MFNDQIVLVVDHPFGRATEYLVLIFIGFA